MAFAHSCIIFICSFVVPVACGAVVVVGFAGGLSGCNQRIM